MRSQKIPSSLGHTLAALMLAGCAPCSGSADEPTEDQGATEAAPEPGEGEAVAVFAGGCFWCMEKPFEKLDGVESVLSGYAGGEVRGPSYHAVSSGSTGHAEAVRVLYDPDEVTYERLLEVFWHNIDPLDGSGQFCDRGNQYRPAIFPLTPEQRRAAERSKKKVQKELGEEVATRIEEMDAFWIAEDYHQDYYRTNPVRYQRYRRACGRDARLRELWGDRAGH